MYLNTVYFILSLPFAFAATSTIPPAVTSPSITTPPSSSATASAYIPLTVSRYTYIGCYNETTYGPGGTRALALGTMVFLPFPLTTPNRSFSLPLSFPLRANPLHRRAKTI